MRFSTERNRLLALARERSILTTQEAVAAGIHRQSLSRLVQDGTLERIERGRYRLHDQEITEHHGLAVVTSAVPRGVICLVSAIAFHHIGTQLPHQVWVALDRRARRPLLHYPPMRVVRFSGKALVEGVEMHTIEGQAVRVYSVAKTLADLFKYRNKIGLDVALEALREAWRDRRCTMDEIDHFARVCRVERVMRPDLEALVG